MKVLAAEKETFTAKLNEVKTELDRYLPIYYDLIIFHHVVAYRVHICIPDGPSSPNSCRSQIKDLETKIAVAESTSVAEKARLSQSIAELKARRDADLVDLKSANSKDMSELRAELAEVRDAESKLKIELQTKREACAKFETDFRAAEMRLREQELKTREAEMNLKVAETQRNHLRSQLEENKEQINRAYKSFEQTSKMHDEALKEKEEWKQKVEELTKDRDAQQKVAHETDMKYNAQINELDKKVQALEHDLADVTEKKNAFEAQLQQQLEETKAAKASEAKVQELYESSRKDREKAYLEVNSLRKLQVENLGNKGSHEQMERIMDLSIKLETARAQVADKATMAAELAKCKEVIKTLRSEAFHAEMVRRGLHNQIQDLKGNIRVMVRVRPFLPHDGTDHATPLRYAADKQGLKLVSGDERKSVNAFKFDHVFGGHTGQELVFKEVSGLVQSALDGYNVCLFSYGQTGSGKTHTMQGSPAGEMRGMIPRSIEKVLETSKKLRSQGWEFGLRVSFLEIYNETIRDLLGKKDAVGLPIKQTRDGKNVEVIGLTKVLFSSLISFLNGFLFVFSYSSYTIAFPHRLNSKPWPK